MPEAGSGVIVNVAEPDPVEMAEGLPLKERSMKSYFRLYVATGDAGRLSVW
jgi:hypothetical protein